MDYIDKPLIRSDLRRKLGKEYYILKRKARDAFSGVRWAKIRPPEVCLYPLMEHRPIILRPLTDVEMYLQENKRTNLMLTLAHLNSMKIASGGTFRVCHSRGRTSQAMGSTEGS